MVFGRRGTILLFVSIRFALGCAFQAAVEAVHFGWPLRGFLRSKLLDRAYIPDFGLLSAAIAVLGIAFWLSSRRAKSSGAACDPINNRYAGGFHRPAHRRTGF